MLPRRSARPQISQTSPHTSRNATSDSSPSSSARGPASLPTVHGASSTHPGQRPEISMDVPSSAQRRSQRQAKRSEPSTPRIDQTVPEPESIEVAADSGDGSIRCVCGFDEYPGLPIIPSERQISRSKSKSSSTVDDGLGAFPEVEIGSPGDWFIQCDRCEAWQHGGCIGLILQSSAPQSYLCEQCDPSFHSLGTDVNGQRYSVYDPTSKKGSKHRPNLSVKLDITQQKTSSPEPKSTDAAVLKRRSTMNSRLAADGEEEQLRLALEASKHDAPEVAEGSVSRGTKRSREEDTDINEPQAKKRRTSSQSLVKMTLRSESNSSHSANRSPDPETTEPLSSRTRRRFEPAPKSPVKPAPKSKAKVEAAPTTKRTTKTNGKAKDDVSNASPAPPSRTASTRATTKAGDVTPPESSQGQMSAPTSRAKGTKAAGARRGRVGRNQYSKDLFEDDAGLLSRSSSPGGTTKRPQRSRAGSSYRTSGLANGVGINGHEFGGGTYRPRSKQVNLNRLSMNEMKKRVAAIGDFVALSSGSSVGGAGVGVVTPASTGSSSNGNGGGGSGSKGGQSVDGAGDQGSASKGALAGTGPMVDLEKFREMSTEQMKEVMMGAVEGWQTQFGKWGER